MNEQLKGFKLRLDSWAEEGRKLLADMKAADDGSIEINDMQDIIINGLGLPDEHS
jgi:hypothetical protein